MEIHGDVGQSYGATQDSTSPPGKGGKRGEITVVIDTACGAPLVGPTTAVDLLNEARPSKFVGRAANGEMIHGK